MLSKQETLPTIRADQAGYMLGEQSIDGFADRDDLSPRARLIVARMAQHYCPKSLSKTQLDLLKASASREQPSAQLVALTRNLEDLDAAHELGLFDDLSAEEVAMIRDPSLHPGIPNGQYPLTIGQASVLTGASTVQLRRWAEAKLVPSIRMRRRVRFFSAGILHAMLLSKAEKYEVSALMRVLRGDDAGERLVRLFGLTLASISTTAGASSDELARTSAALVRLSKTIRAAAETYSA